MDDRETRNSNPSYYAIIPADIRYNKNLSPNAKLLYGEITALCTKEGFCWASNVYFANLYNVHKGTISAWVASLVTEGYIEYSIENDVNRKIYLVKDKIKPMKATRKRVPPSGNPDTPFRKSCTPPSGNPEHNNTVNNTKNNIVTRKSGDPMSLNEFIELCRKSKQKHIQVIAEWAEGEQPRHTTYGEWQAFVKRNLRPAKELAPYPIEKIEKAYQKMQEDVVRKLPNGKTVGFITKYSLETVIKYIDLV